MERQLHPVGDDVAQFLGVVLVELDGVGPAEGRGGGRVQHVQHILLRYQDERQGRPCPDRLLVEPGKLVDEVAGPLPDQDVRLVQHHHQVHLVLFQVLADGAEHLRDAESAVREMLVEVGDQALQHRAL